MKRLVLWTLAVALTTGGIVDTVGAFERGFFRRGAGSPIGIEQAGYYDPAWGAPLAVLVPPTARFQTHYGWGIGATRVTRIPSQFQSGYLEPGYVAPGSVRPAPVWPSSTDQLGDYYIRGPW